MHKPIYLRAYPSTMYCKEVYNFDINISKFGGMDTVLEPHATIDLMIPHDGEKHFSWDSVEDIHHQLPQDFKNSSDKDIERIKARLGFLVFENFSKTDLKNTFEETGSYPTLPIDLDIRNTLLNTDIDLISDQFESKASFSYKPHELPIPPVKINMTYEDEIAPSQSSQDSEQEDIGHVLLIQQSFTNEPSITLHLELQLPIEIGQALVAAKQVPTLKMLNIDWPIADSICQAMSQGEPITSPKVNFNPLLKRLEVEEITLESAVEDTDTGVYRYQIPKLVISIPTQSPLQDLSKLNGDLQVQIPTLISQTFVNFFDNTGVINNITHAHYESLINVHFSYSLQEAVLQKPCSPALQVVLDNTILEQIHISDITRILKQLKFTHIKHSHIQEDRLASQVKRHCTIEAIRSDGPKVLSLHLSIDSVSEIPNTQSEYTPSATTTIKMHSSVNEDGIQTNMVLNQIHKLIKERCYRLAKLV